jgi:hypothetical protein
MKSTLTVVLYRRYFLTALYDSNEPEASKMDSSSNERIKEWIKCSSLPENRPQAQRGEGTVPTKQADMSSTEAIGGFLFPNSHISFGGENGLMGGMRSLQTRAESALNLAAAACAAVIPMHMQCAGSRKPAEQELPSPRPEMFHAQYERTSRGRELSRGGVPGRPSLAAAAAAAASAAAAPPACGDGSERGSHRSSALSAMSTGRGRGPPAAADAATNSRAARAAGRL